VKSSFLSDPLAGRQVVLRVPPLRKVSRRQNNGAFMLFFPSKVYNYSVTTGRYR